MDGPGTYSQPPQAGGSKDESGTAAKDTISIGSGDRVSGADRMGMEVHPAPIHIGSKVWIGAGVIVTKGVTIGDNSVIAAGAVVTHDIPSNVIAAGVPARILKEI